MDRKTECEIVQDLLYGYVDKVLNPESKKLVDKHLIECKECQKKLEEINNDSMEENSEIKQIDYLKKIRRKTKSLVLIIVLICIIAILLLLKDNIITFMFIKQYESKYKDIDLIEKTLSFDGSKIDENNIKIDEFQISLSDFSYDKDEKKLDFNLNFENGSNINNVGYILRVYNNDYCLGDEINGYISLESGVDYVVNYNKFYEENFDYHIKTIDLVNGVDEGHDLSNECRMLKQDELLENGGLIHHISYELPEEFIINDMVKIELFDLNYQNIGDKEIYRVQKSLTQIRYMVNLSEN